MDCGPWRCQEDTCLGPPGPTVQLHFRAKSTCSARTSWPTRDDASRQCTTQVRFQSLAICFQKCYGSRPQTEGCDAWEDHQIGSRSDASLERPVGQRGQRFRLSKAWDRRPSLPPAVQVRGKANVQEDWTTRITFLARHSEGRGAEVVGPDCQWRQPCATSFRRWRDVRRRS